MKKDLGEELENVESGIENLKNKDFTLFGIKMSPVVIGAAFAGLSTIVGALYAGFVMYQKVEAVAGLDVGAYEQKMELIDQKLNSQQKLLSSIESNLNDAKTNMYRIETKVSEKLSNYDTKLDRFENKVEKNKTDLEDKIQKALDNPLANQ
jgi:uncharacterized protein YukE